MEEQQDHCNLGDSPSYLRGTLATKGGGGGWGRSRPRPRRQFDCPAFIDAVGTTEPPMPNEVQSHEEQKQMNPKITNNNNKKDIPLRWCRGLILALHLPSIDPPRPPPVYCS